MTIHRFDDFILLEGGNALPGVRHIKKEEVRDTIAAIEHDLFPALRLKGFGIDAIRVGSAGVKAKSGDMDIAIVMKDFEHNFPEETLKINGVLDFMRDMVQQALPELQVRALPGLNIVSIAFPIAGTVGGFVQLDLIPVRTYSWGKFVYAPVSSDDSEYKSAHRNWLLCAIMASIKRDKVFVDGQLISYNGYLFRLSDGLFNINKSREGARGNVLKNMKNDKESEKLATRSPKEFVKFAFGDQYEPKDVRTFEQCYRIISRKDFKWHDKIGEIKDYLIKFLKGAKLTIPDILYEEDKK